jgi:ABC-2 type transport system ATP-binding protein
VAPIIEVQGLTHHYDDHAAIEDVHFEVAAGTVSILLGEEGAGKSTVLRILATLLRPTAGEARVGGFSVRSDAPGVRRVTGYVPARSAVYPRLTVRAHLECYVACQGARQALVGDLLDLFDLSTLHDTPGRALSRRERQRLSLARALIHDPSVLLIDEPAAERDPLWGYALDAMLHELHAMGKTIVIASRQLPAIAGLPGATVTVMRSGRIITSGTLDTLAPLARDHGRRIQVTVTGSGASARARLRPLSGTKVEAVAMRAGRTVLDVRCPDDDQAQAAVVQALVKGGIDVLGVVDQGPALDGLYHEVTTEDRRGH